MTTAKSPKNRGSVKLEPLNGKFFDIKPSQHKKNFIGRSKHSDFFRFAVVALIVFFVLGLGNAYVLGRELVFESQEAAYEGYESIKMGVDSLLAQDAVTAREHFLKAESSFYELSQTAAPITSQKNNLFTEGLYLDTADKLIEGALEVARIGKELTNLMEGFSLLPQTAMTVLGGQSGGLIEALAVQKTAFDEILGLTTSLQRKMTTINDRVLPGDMQEKVISARAQIGELMAVMLRIEDGFQVALRLLGDRMPHRYLVLLQNNHELRATGGFIGSYLIVDMNDGKITKMEAKDVYETDGQLKDIVQPPPGINRVADRLYMRDANYSPDFPTSAQDIMWFLEHSKGPSVDTVIAIDQTLVEELLKMSGPLLSPDFPFQLRADNFNDIISFYTEAKISDSVTPKQLLFDLIPAFQSQFSGLGEWEKLASLAKTLIEKGHLQAYSSDPKIQQLIDDIGLGGRMIRTDEKTDYLSVVTTSIGGNKSDAFIKTDLLHRSIIGTGGLIENELTIKKTHSFGDDDRQKIRQLINRYGTGKLTEESLFFILGEGPNLDYMRVYVPEGSQLLSASGIDIASVEVSEDLDYTVFGFTGDAIKPGQVQEVKLRYLLPFRLSLKPADDYKWVAERQAGTENQTIIKELQTPDILQITKSHPPGEDIGPRAVSLKADFNRNLIFTATVKNKD